MMAVIMKRSLHKSLVSSCRIVYANCRGRLRSEIELGLGGQFSWALALEIIVNINMKSTRRQLIQ